MLNLRRPMINYTFNSSNSFGLTSVLTKQLASEEAYVESNISSLSILLSGPIPLNPVELLSSVSTETFLKRATEQFDHILFETPSLLAVTDGQILVNKCDGVL